MDGMDKSRLTNIANSEFKNCASSSNLSNLNLSLTVLARTDYENQGLLSIIQIRRNVAGVKIP